MNIRTDGESLSQNSFNVSKWVEERQQMLDQIGMLEREIDRQSTIIDALVKAIRVIERG